MHASKTPIRLKFVDFWPTFNPLDNEILLKLRHRYDVSVGDDPDFLIFSCFGWEHLQYNCPRIFFSRENSRPIFRRCDYAITYDFLDDPRHLRSPEYCWRETSDRLFKPTNFDPGAVLAQKTKFCNFVYSNPRCTRRNEFFKKLSRYKRVDSGGRLMNNLGHLVDDKVAFLRNYKFTIAFENSEFPGYTTEKLYEPMEAASMPIYWGNPLVHVDYNTKSFLNWYDYGSDEALIEAIIAMDQNDDLYLEMMGQPWLHDNQLPQLAQTDFILDWLDGVFAQPPQTAYQHARKRIYNHVYTVRQAIRDTTRPYRRKLSAAVGYDRAA